MNPKDGLVFNEILWSFLDQSRRWGQELRTWSQFTVSLATLYRSVRAAKGIYIYIYIYLYHLTSLLMHAIGPKVWIK